MKVLWFTNIPLPAMLSAETSSHAGTGGWMGALLDTLRTRPDLELAVASVVLGLPDCSVNVGGVHYYSVCQGPRRRIMRYTDGDSRAGLLDKCVNIVKEFKPDVIHIHGTERFYGLLIGRKEITVPIVISIQGLLSECCTWRNSFGDLPISEIIKMHHFVRALRGLGPLWDFYRSRRNAVREKNIISSNRYFMGRTTWDHAHIKALNPNAHYYHVGELLRPEFNQKIWHLDACQRHSIIFTNARGPRRGVDTLIQAMSLLKRRFPDVLIRLAGIDGFSGEYGQYLAHMAECAGVAGNMEFLGMLNGSQMSNALASSHVFILSSLIENSPNSLCEAQMVGMPCVATYTGGVPSLITERETGLMVPIGDGPVIAARLEQVFENDALATELGTQARQIAIRRHDSDVVVNQLVATYHDVVIRENEK